MTTTFNQGDNGASNGAIQACSGLAAAAITGDSDCVYLGGLGLNSQDVRVDIGTDERFHHFECAPGWVEWDASDITMRIEVSVGNADFIWDSMYACRITSAGAAVVTVGSVTGDAVSMIAGTHDITVTGKATGAADGGSATDHLYCVAGGYRNGHGGITITTDNDGLILGPEEGAAALSPMAYLKRMEHSPAPNPNLRR